MSDNEYLKLRIRIKTTVLKFYETFLTVCRDEAAQVSYLQKLRADPSR